MPVFVAQVKLVVARRCGAERSGPQRSRPVARRCEFHRRSATARRAQSSRQTIEPRHLLQDLGIEA